MLSLVHVASTNSDRRVSYRSCQCLLKFSYPIGAHTSFKLSHHAVYIKDLYIFCYNVNCLTIRMALITLLLRLPMNETRGVNYIFVFIILNENFAFSIFFITASAKRKILIAAYLTEPSNCLSVRNFMNFRPALFTRQRFAELCKPRACY